MQYDNLILDFESYFDTKLSLRKLSITDYVNHPDFFAYGASLRRMGIDHTAQFYNYAELPSALAKIDWAKTRLIAHNTHFDGYVLYRRYGIQAAKYSCTLSLSRAIHQGAFPNDLGTLAYKYNLGLKLDTLTSLKGKKILTPKEWGDLALYCNTDADICAALYELLAPKINADEHELLNITLGWFCRPRLRVNATVAQQALDEEVAQKEACINATGETKDALSGDDSFAQLLSDAGVTPPMKQGKNGPIYAFAKTDIAFQRLLEHEDDKIALLASARRAVQSTLAETRAIRLLNEAARGELPVCLHFAGAHTWRWSGGNKINLQNLTRGSKLRECIEAPEGYVLLVLDQGQIEVRTLYVLTGQHDGLAIFATDGDPYNEMATFIYGHPVDRKHNPDHKIKGHVGKCVVLGCGYGMGAPKFRYSLATGILGGQRVHITDEDAQKAVTGYRTKNDKVVAGWKEGDTIIKHLCWGSFNEYESPLGVTANRDEKRIYLPGGTFLHYPNLTWDDHEAQFVYTHNRQAAKTYGAKLIENITQAVARNIIAKQLLIAEQFYPSVTSTHDEIVWMVPEDKADDAMDLLTAIMTEQPNWLPPIPLKVDGGYARNYSK